MSNILVLGAGFVAGPLVNYLLKKQHHITVASQFLDEAQLVANDYPAISIAEVNVLDEQSLGDLVKQHDMVVSFIPADFHLKVASQCIKYKKHMLTASYETPEIKALHQQAHDSDITIINEIGLDPGIDHLSAMKIIDEIEDAGGKLTSFVSWCGGLPSPDSNNNPLGYKFAWAPLGVLMALLNEATYLKEGKVVTISSEQLLETLSSIKVSASMTLEGYPNRDSVSYRDIYGITDASEVFRGTLRYQGFSEIMQCCKHLGLLSTKDFDSKHYSNWKAVLTSQVDDLSEFMSRQSEMVNEALIWLGLLDEENPVAEGKSIIDSFCHLLMEKLSYTDSETDMVVLQHQFRSINAQGTEELRESTLILHGDVDGYSAMAKTVGTPAAIATDLIVSGKIKARGVILPMTSEIYTPMLEILTEQGIVMKESLKVVNNN